MAAFKQSLSRETPTKRAPHEPKPAKTPLDRRQAALLLPLSGGRRRKTEAATESFIGRTSGRKTA